MYSRKKLILSTMALTLIATSVSPIKEVFANETEVKSNEVNSNASSDLVNVVKFNSDSSEEATISPLLPKIIYYENFEKGNPLITGVLETEEDNTFARSTYASNGLQYIKLEKGTNVLLEQGKKYVVSFDYRAKNLAQYNNFIIGITDGYQSIIPSNTPGHHWITPTTEWGNFVFEFVASVTTDSPRISFYASRQGAKPFDIDNISIISNN